MNLQAISFVMDGPLFQSLTVYFLHCSRCSREPALTRTQCKTNVIVADLMQQERSVVNFINVRKTRAFYVDEIDTWNMFSEKKDFFTF